MSLQGQQDERRLHYPAGSDMMTLKRFVKAANGVLAYCGAGQEAIGVLELPINSGGEATVLHSGVILVEVGSGGVTCGAEVTSDADGKAVAIAALTATASIAALTATASGANAAIPDGEVPMTAASAKPTLTITQPTITMGGSVSVTLAGGALPIKVNGTALDTVTEGFARILLHH